MLPQRAPVEPHVIAPETGDSLPLVDEVRAWIDEGRERLFELVGDWGSGKTTALAHLAAVLPPEADVLLLDDPSPEQLRDEPEKRPVVYAAPRPSRQVATSYLLAPWGEDEWIEYLLSL